MIGTRLPPKLKRSPSNLLRIEFQHRTYFVRRSSKSMSSSRDSLQKPGKVRWQSVGSDREKEAIWWGIHLWNLFWIPFQRLMRLCRLTKCLTQAPLPYRLLLNCPRLVLSRGVKLKCRAWTHSARIRTSQATSFCWTLWRVSATSTLQNKQSRASSTT